jgi:hypothetical protein
MKTQLVLYHWGLGVFHAKAVNSFFHLCGCGYHHNRVNDIPVIAGTPKADDDPVAHYLGYYNWSP